MEEVIRVKDCCENLGDYDIPIHNAIIVSQNATNGDVIMDLFDIKEIHGMLVTIFVVFNDGTELSFLRKWWDKPFLSTATSRK